jgi:hypothetical protein
MARRAVNLAALTLFTIPVASCGGSSEAVSVPGRAMPAARSSKPPNAGPTATPASGPNGIVRFGHPAGPVDRAAISAALRGYTLALAADNGAVACSHLASWLRAQATAGVTSGAQGQTKSCAQLLTSMFAHEGSQARAAQRDTVITAVRVDGDRAFAIFRQPGVPAEFFPMQREGGQWKVGALGGSMLPPS